MDKEKLNQIVEKYEELNFLIHKRVEYLIHQQISETLTYDQHYVLKYIHKRKMTTASELAELLNVNKSAITALINRLEEKELIVRKRLAEDRRIVHLSLSERGHALFDQCEQKINVLVTKLINKFNEDEIVQFVQTYEKLAIILDEAIKDKKGDHS